MAKEIKTLIVVSKDELLLNLFKKIVEENNDELKLVCWDEETWLQEKKVGIIDDKVLLIGKIKGWDSLVPLIDKKYDKHGIMYGWSTSQAIMLADVTGIDESGAYNLFLDDLNAYDIPSSLKGERVEEVVEEKEKNFFQKAFEFVKKTVKPITDKVDPEQKKKNRQQYILGINEFYKNDIKDFIK